MQEINSKIMNGDGIFTREPGVLQPSARKLLEQVGNEEIKTLQIVRTPLSSFTKGFLNTISLGQFDKISKKYYDEMFHLSLWINGQYNLEKNEVVYFNTKNPKEKNSQVRDVKNIPAGLTIQQLIDNTRKQMGNENFSNYDAEKLNCQNFLINVLEANRIGNSSDKDFIFQDATKIFKELPEYAKVLGKVSVKLGAIFNRLIYGEGQMGGGAEEDEREIKELIAEFNQIRRYRRENPDMTDEEEQKYEGRLIEIVERIKKLRERPKRERRELMEEYNRIENLREDPDITDEEEQKYNNQLFEIWQRIQELQSRDLDFITQPTPPESVASIPSGTINVSDFGFSNLSSRKSSIDVEGLEAPAPGESLEDALRIVPRTRSYSSNTQFNTQFGDPYPQPTTRNRRNIELNTRPATPPNTRPTNRRRTELDTEPVISPPEITPSLPPPEITPSLPRLGLMRDRASDINTIPKINKKIEELNTEISALLESRNNMIDDRRNPNLTQEQKNVMNKERIKISSRIDKNRRRIKELQERKSYLERIQGGAAPEDYEERLYRELNEITERIEYYMAVEFQSEQIITNATNFLSNTNLTQDDRNFYLYTIQQAQNRLVDAEQQMVRLEQLKVEKENEIEDYRTEQITEGMQRLGGSGACGKPKGECMCGMGVCKPDEHYHPENKLAGKDGCMKNHLMTGGSQGGRINATGLIDSRVATLTF